MKKYILILLVALLGFASCSEEWMSDVVPTDRLEDKDAFLTIKDARNAVNGVFSLMQGRFYYGADYFKYGTLKGIDVRSTSQNKRGTNMYIYNETTEASNSGMWTSPYECLVSVSNAIANIEKLETTNDEEKAQKEEITANFYALRALNHFDLLRIYARIPAAVLDASSELGIVLADHVITKSEKPARVTLKESYDFVIKDFTKALELMPEVNKYSDWFNKTSIRALLSRVYLYNGDNQKAYDMAKMVIADTKYKLTPYGDYAESWTPTYNNTEALLMIINTDEDNANREGIGYLWNKDGYNVMRLTNSFEKILFADNADDRINAFATDTIKDGAGVVTDIYYYSTKFPEYYANKLQVIRLSEMYFTAAEAIYKISNSNAAEAATLINEVIEARTDVANKLSAADINIEKIILEKRKEFIGEGQSFFDFMRNKIDIVRDNSDLMAGAPQEIKSSDYRTIQPIPRIELNSNENIQQNPGYAE